MAGSSASATSASSARSVYGRDPVTGDLVTEVGGAAVFARSARSRSTRLHGPRLPAPSAAAQGPAQAAAARPDVPGRASATSTPTRRCGRSRLHPLRSAASLRPADERRLYEPSGGSWPRRSSGAAVRSMTTPRPTATEHAGALQVYQRAGAPVHAAAGRSGGSSSGPLDPLLLRRQRLSPRDRQEASAILRGMTGGRRRTGGRWTDLAGEGALGITPSDAAGARSRARSDRTRRAAATRRATARATFTVPGDEP